MKTARRWCSASKQRVDIQQPKAIHMYNTYMGGVDRFDQNVGNYRAGIRSKKWWFPCFIFALEAAVQNAWQLYRIAMEQRDSPAMDLLQFRRDIVSLYLRKYSSPVSLGRPKHPLSPKRRAPESLRFDGLNH